MNKDEMFVAELIKTNWTIQGDALKIHIHNTDFEPIFKIMDWQKEALLKYIPFRKIDPL